jgi:hypothetical protein
MENIQCKMKRSGCFAFFDELQHENFLVRHCTSCIIEGWGTEKHSCNSLPVCLPGGGLLLCAAAASLGCPGTCPLSASWPWLSLPACLPLSISYKFSSSNCSKKLLYLKYE